MCFKNVLAYYDVYYKYYSTITKNNDNYKFEQEKKSTSLYFSYQVQEADDNVTINERHFGNSFCTIISENNSSYTSPVSNFDYAIEKDNTSVTELISNNNSAEENSNILSSTLTYNADSFVTEKSYNKNNLSFTMSLDENGIINSVDDRYFSYDALGELISTSGDINSTYTYDSRGNMTSKTVNGITTSFSYNNENWQDQLTGVNGNPLSYDANGNLLSYNGVRYRWSRGKLLSSVTTEENTCFYTYDNNGYRLSKDVNGDITYFDVFNGKILAQHGTHNLYFQYNNEKPIGFILDNNQYYYITNIKGDIVGITDENGDLIASYVYDEWGKLLNIETAQAENETQYEIALLNPFRYRGYYYDEETGMYFLQSRYYNPDLCRFISADSFDYIKADNPLTVNAYIYCINNPIYFFDPTGCQPKNTNNNVALAIIQGLIAAIELDYLNSLLETIDLSLDKIAKVSYTAVKEISLTFITTFNVLWSYIPEYIRGEAAGTATTFTLDKMFESFAKNNGIRKDTSVVRSFGILFSLIGFSVDLDNAGKGEIFTNSEDTIMSVLGLCIDLFSLFLGPYWSIIIPISSDIIIDVIALRIKGAIILC